MEKKPESTIVTTITITHILQDVSGKDAKEFAMVIANAAEDCVKAGYRDHMLPQGIPDDICISGVQIFERDGE